LSDTELYCKIFVDFDGSRDALVRIAAPAGARVGDGFSFESDELSVDVRRNEDFDAGRRDEPEGFLHFRYYLDVDPVANVARMAYVRAVDQLLGRLWATGAPAVAACDFEDELHQRLS
jgi:hypothetical protein